MASWEYRLSTEALAHSADVRSIAPGPDGCFLSGSRDRTARLWHPQGTRDFINSQTYRGHDNFVSSVCFIGPCQSYPEGLVVTGCNDKIIRAYNIQDCSPIIRMKGHENTVCFVTPGNRAGTVLSASWDSTGCLWSVENPDKPLLTLKGHEAVVWAIIELSNKCLVTGSADKLIFIWNQEGKKIKSLSGHTDCVRGLCVASTETFMSCANDASVRLWTNNGDCLNTFYGHSNYIYSICINPYVGSDCFVTSGEDSTVRVWSGGDNVCTLTLPAQSVWCVTCLCNGDIVTGSSDGIIRVFTKDSSRRADEAVLEGFENSVKMQYENNSQEIGGYKISDLPGPEILLEPGKSDGQTKLIRSGTKVKCYSWSSIAQSWTELGEVTGSAKPTEGKQMFQGKEYDYVFSVDIEDGKPPLKLPYNSIEDPWVAAQTFIHKNLLPQAYLEQVANFIIQNSKKTGAVVNDSNYVDPFTGGTRYVPDTQNNMNKVGNVGNADPFTGASSYSTSNSSNSQVGCKIEKVSSYFPHTSYLRFDQANCTVILDKLIEFNQRLDESNRKLSNDELILIMELTDQKTIPSPTTVVHLKSLLEWPIEILFPVLDILRLAVRNEYVNAYLFKKDKDEEMLMQHLLNNLLPESPQANQLLVLRTFNNSFCHLEGEMAVLKEYENILNALICLKNLNKNIQIAVATLFLNLCVALSQQNDTTFLCQCLTETYIKFSENEAQFRGLVALGTLISTTPTKSTISGIILTNDNFMKRLKMDSEISDTETDPNKRKVGTCSRDVMQFL